MEYASLTRRIQAHLLDILVLLAAMVILVLIGRGHQHLEMVLTPVRGALLFLYTFYYHARTGQTLGKKWMGIKVVSDRGEPIGFAQSAKRNAILLLMSIPWPLATVIAISRIPAAQYVALWGHGEVALEASLRPQWYDQIQLYMIAVFIIDILAMILSSQRRSLHDLIGGTAVIVAGKPA